ncbi:protein SLC31A2-like isoform X2 [Haliotis asinina]|uniref:protein SLC31A2-like isoform X2 n=1 Tax=Haliotis asinina TaxID=109174 RepID=UPI00353262AE
MDMPTYFFTTTELKNFLFKNLNISGVKGFVVLCLVIFFIMALFEGFKLVKIFFELKVKQDPLTYSHTDSSAEDREGLLSSLMFPADMGQIRRRRMKYHFFGCMSHMFNMIIAYLIMLAFMSYSAWVSIAITLVMHYSTSQASINLHIQSGILEIGALIMFFVINISFKYK